MTDLPKQYAWLEAEPGPRILVEALKTYGRIRSEAKAPAEPYGWSIWRLMGWKDL